MTADLQKLIARELPEITRIRHDLHQHPELMYQETRTAELVRNELERAGVQVKAGLAGGTGVLGHLPATNGHQDQPAIALRADMDALPILEQTGRPYTSKTPGVMHACGHDGHTAILIGAARILAAIPDRPVPITFLFQPAEEGGAGGEKMCQDGCLAGEKGGGLGAPVGRVYGLHGWPQLPLGLVATRPGPILAATDDFLIRVRGEGGHAAYPHLARDPIAAAAHLVTAIQTVVSRRTSPLDAAVVTVGRIEGGSANNIIPEEVELEGTLRTLRPETRRASREAFNEAARGAAAALGCEADIEWHEGYPVTCNDEAETERFFRVARQTLGEDRVTVMPEPSMGGEDFSYYGQYVPTCFYLLGLTPDGARDVPQLHQPGFDFNDDAIPTGLELMCRLALTAP